MATLTFIRPSELVERAQRLRREVDNERSQYLADCYARAAKRALRRAQADLFEEAA